MANEDSGLSIKDDIEYRLIPFPFEGSTDSPMKTRRCDRVHQQMPVDAGVSGWVLNLRVMIEQLYWNYLSAKSLNPTESDGSKKLCDLRQKLENHAKEYLQMVPHQIKFYNSEVISEVFMECAKQDPECANLEKVCRTFKTMEEFSTHLMKFPGKFKTVHFRNNACINFDSSDKVWLQNLDSFGFENLDVSQKMLKYLGFSSPNQNVGSKLLLQGPLDQYCVNEFARDCIMAVEECRISASIIRIVTTEKFTCSWEEVLTFRHRYAGTAEQAAREIILTKTNQKLLQNATKWESYINKKEREKEKLVFQMNNMKKELKEVRVKYEELSRKISNV